MLDRRARVGQAIVTEVVDVLDERADLAPGVGLSSGLTFRAVARAEIAREGFAQHRDQRSVAGEEHAVKIAFLLPVSRRDVQANQRFPGAGYAGDEADRLASSVPRLLNDGFDRPRRHREIDR